MAITRLDDRNANQFVFVHFNVKVDNRTCMRIEESIPLLVEDLQAQAVRHYDEIIVHDWQAVLFSRPFDGDHQILHYLVVDAPDLHNEALNRKTEIFVDGLVKLHIARFINRT